jgi:hypothetical protein
LLGGVLFGLRNLTEPQRRKAATSEAIGNARSLSFALFGFESEYGKLLDAAHPFWQGKPSVIAWPDF